MRWTQLYWLMDPPPKSPPIKAYQPNPVTNTHSIVQSQLAKCVKARFHTNPGHLDRHEWPFIASNTYSLQKAPIYSQIRNLNRGIVKLTDVTISETPVSLSSCCIRNSLEVRYRQLFSLSHSYFCGRLLSLLHEVHNLTI